MNENEINELVRDDLKFIDSVIKAAKNGVAIEHLTTMASAYYHKKYSTEAMNTIADLSPEAVAKAAEDTERLLKAENNALAEVTPQVGECDNAEDHATLLINREEANRELANHNAAERDEKGFLKENRPTCVRCFKPLEGAREDIGTRVTCYKCLGQISFSFVEEEEDNAERNQSK